MKTKQKSSVNKDITMPTDPKATTNPQPVAQPSTTPDDWRDKFLLEVIDDCNTKGDLFRILDLARAQHESENPIPGLTLLLNYYVANVSNSILINSRSEITSITRLIRFLTKLDEDFACFNIGSDYCDVSMQNEDRVALLEELEG